LTNGVNTFDPKRGKFTFVKGELNDDEVVDFFAVGDITLARYVEKRIKDISPDYPFKKMKDFLNRKDILFGNLETPFSSSKPDKPLREKIINFCVDPAVGEGLKYAGFDVLSLANNHAMDYGPSPMMETVKILNDMGIKTVGCGEDITEARKPAVLERKGLSLAFLAYASLDELTNASDTEPGTSPLLMENVEEDIEDIKDMVDYIIVSVHKGHEFIYYPHPEHQKRMREIVDLGADIVLGHHPHFPQGFEAYKNKLIFYSLSKFVFDEPYPNRFESSLFKGLRGKIFGVDIRVSKEQIVDFEIVPLVMSNEFQTSLQEGERKSESLEFMRRLSLPLAGGDLEKAFYRGGRDYLIAQMLAFFHLMRIKGLKTIYHLLRWIVREDTIRMIVGTTLKVDVPPSLLKLKKGFAAMCSNLINKLKCGGNVWFLV